MDAEMQAALVLLVGGLPALGAVMWAVERPALPLPAFIVTVFLAAAAFALAVGLAARW